MGSLHAAPLPAAAGASTSGLARMVIGEKAEDVMTRLRGIPCKGATSCPDQLSRAIEQYMENERAGK